MAHRNRVFPDKSIRSLPLRGAWLGNRGGRFHREDKSLKAREFASKQWIYCLLEFKNRHRDVLTKGYTELFFCDEISALASGHRPCFECQRPRAVEFAKAWQKAFRLEKPPKATQMDEVLHKERFQSQNLQLNENAMFEMNNQFYAMQNGAIHQWDWGVGETKTIDLTKLKLLTPPTILKVLSAGFTLK